MLFHFTSTPGIPCFRWNRPVIAPPAAGALLLGRLLKSVDKKTDDRLDIVAPPNEDDLQKN
jgi:hypothetical protein